MSLSRHVVSSCHVRDRLSLRCEIHQLVERIYQIVMFILPSPLRVVREVPRDVRRQDEANRGVDFYQAHFAVETEA